MEYHEYKCRQFVIDYVWEREREREIVGRSMDGHIAAPYLSIQYQIPEDLWWKRNKRNGKMRKPLEASVLMQRLSYPTETVLSSKITRNVE